MRKRSILLVAGALAIAREPRRRAGRAGSERTSAGTVVIIHDQEPPTLRGDWEDNNLTATALVMNNIWSAARSTTPRRRSIRGCSRPSRSWSRRARDGHVQVQADGGLE